MAEQILQFRRHRRWAQGLTLREIKLVEPTPGCPHTEWAREHNQDYDGHLYLLVEGTLDELASVADPEMLDLTPKRGEKRGRDQFGDHFSVWQWPNDKSQRRCLSRHIGRSAPNLEPLIARAPRRWRNTVAYVEQLLERLRK